MLARATRRKPDGMLMPCEVHQTLASWLDQRRSADLWSHIANIEKHVTSKTAPSAPFTISFYTVLHVFVL